MKLNRSTYPQTDGQTEIVNGTLVKLLRGYNQNHPKTRDQNLVYIQHSYNRATHTSTRKSPFETCFRYFPPSPLDIAYLQQGGVKEDLKRDSLRAKKFVEKIRHIHIQVQEILHKLHEKYTTRHDQYIIEKSFKGETKYGSSSIRRGCMGLVRKPRLQDMVPLR